MHGLKYDKNENQSDIVSKISECFSEIGLPYDYNVIVMTKYLITGFYVNREGPSYNFLLIDAG